MSTINFSVNDPVMLTDSTCALYTAHKQTKYTYGSAAKAYKYAVCLRPLHGIPGKFALMVISWANIKYLQWPALS